AGGRGVGPLRGAGAVLTIPLRLARRRPPPLVGGPSHGVSRSVAPLASCSPASCLARASASPSLAGSLPPAWAIVGLPPPPPPTTLATCPTSLPACSPFFTRSSVTDAISPTLPSSA